MEIEYILVCEVQVLMKIHKFIIFANIMECVYYSYYNIGAFHHHNCTISCKICPMGLGMVFIVVSWVSTHGCLNIHCNFGPHGHLPGT